MFANGENDKVRFKVQMFGFSGEYADNNVWLHCVVRVCGDDCEKVILWAKNSSGVKAGAYWSYLNLYLKDCGMRRRRATDNLDNMPTRYTDIAVVTSPRIMVTDEIDVEIEEVQELKPFIEGKWRLNPHGTNHLFRIGRRHRCLRFVCDFGNCSRRHLGRCPYDSPKVKSKRVLSIQPIEPIILEPTTRAWSEWYTTEKSERQRWYCFQRLPANVRSEKVHLKS